MCSILYHSFSVLHLIAAVTDLIEATPEEDVLRRDIYDRPPIFQWTDGRVVLLGDSAHAMQPNLGQGGCMAIEDAFQLAVDLTKEVDRSASRKMEADIDGVLRGYFQKRLVRVSAIHGMAGMAAFMASTYKAYLGEGLGPLEWITKFKIPHPGRVSGQAVLKLTMPMVLDWVLGGYNSQLKKSGRIPVCRIEDKPTGFDESDFALFMRDDDALLRAAHAVWSIACDSSGDGNEDIRIHSSDPTYISFAGNSIIQCESRNGAHAMFECESGDYYFTCFETRGILFNDKHVSTSRIRIRPGDYISFESGNAKFLIRLKHQSLTNVGHGQYNRKEEAQFALQ